MGNIIATESSVLRQRKYSVKVLLDKIFNEEANSEPPVLPPTPRNIKGNPAIFGPDTISPRSEDILAKEKRTDESELVPQMRRERNT